MAASSEDFPERTIVCFVVDGAKGTVRTLTNPHLVECYDEPKQPPIKGVVQRIDLTQFEVGTKIRIHGIVTDDSVFGAKVVGEVSVDGDEGDVSRSQEWKIRAKEYTGIVRNRQLYVHGYNIEGPSEVFVKPEFPPVTGVTLRLDLDLFEGSWIKIKAVFDRHKLWGAILLGETVDPDEVPTERVLDQENAVKVPRQPAYKGNWAGARRIVLGINTSDSSPLVFDFVLNKFTSPEDYMLVYVQIPENEPLASKMTREKLRDEWVRASSKQGVVCEVFSSCIDVKAGLKNEVERVGANTVVCGSQVDAAADSIFHYSLADYVLKQCSKPDGKPVRVRRVNIPSDRHLDKHRNYIMEDLE